MAQNKLHVFRGSLIHSLSKENPLKIFEGNGLIGVEDGKILFIDVTENLERLKAKYSFGSESVISLGESEWLMPGFVDTHIHASQYPNAGLGLDLELLDWLQKYTFPMEARFSDPTFAGSVYRKVVTRTLSNGTTTASYFTTIHRESCQVLADIVEELGQRALVGKVSMDCLQTCPEFYVEGTQESLDSTREFVKNLLNRNNSRVRPTITPRFAISCSETLLRGLGDLAKEFNVHIQTHLCESETEIEFTLQLFPNFKNYTEIYEKTGLLTKKSIMAHGVHLKDNEMESLAKHETGVSHCPTSNLCILSGLCPVRKLLGAGVKVGLGTDVSGGYSPSMMEAMRHSILTGKMIKMRDQSYEQLSYKDAIFLATLGGAQALSLDEEIGNFQVGKAFDALRVNLTSPESKVHVFPGETLSQLIEKFVMLGDDRNIVQVFVDGRSVK